MRWLAAAVASTLLSGCGAAPSWEPVDLGDVRPSALAAVGDALLVAGTAGDGPALLVLDAAGVDGVRLVPQEPYAAQATLIAVSASATGMDAIGTVVGGAHSNPRWTLWDGSATELTSRPQEFFTFGGHDAGPLLAVVQTSSGPVIIGSRTTASGARAVLYTRSGTTWSPLPSPEELTSTREVELGFAAATAVDDRILIAGDELLLSGGLEQRPVVWTGSAGGRWQRVELPTASIAGSGITRATSLACSDTGCWVAGWVRGHPVAWSLDAASGVAGPPAVLPGEPRSGNDPRALVAMASGVPVVATGAIVPGLEAGCAGGWRPIAAPGTVDGLVEAAGGLYAVSGGALWRLGTTPC